jgi:hypothetical protein
MTHGIVPCAVQTLSGALEKNEPKLLVTDALWTCGAFIRVIVALRGLRSEGCWSLSPTLEVNLC